MDFARKQMEKYGWKDGDGLGKEGNQGITIALKPHYKTGKEGMGFDLSKDLVDAWWTRSYSDSLNRVNVSTVEGDKVVVSTPCEEEDGSPMAKMRKRMLKANFTDFTKAATLSNGEMVDEDNIESSISKTVLEVKTTFQLTDEELLKACGGRTAHKAARFGMKLSGKLARIASQEEKVSIISSEIIEKTLLLETNDDKKSKKRKKRENVVYENTIGIEEVFPETHDNDNSCSKKRKKKNKKNKHYEEETLSIVADCTVPDQDTIMIITKKSKKHKRKHQNLCE